MWIFLATEVMLFGGLFTAYTVYRTRVSARLCRRQPAHGCAARRRSIPWCCWSAAPAWPWPWTAARLGQRRGALIGLPGADRAAGAGVHGASRAWSTCSTSTRAWCPGSPGSTPDRGQPRSSCSCWPTSRMTGLHAIHLRRHRSSWPSCCSGARPKRRCRSATRRSSWSACTGTSWTSSGSSCCRCCTCSGCSH